jgi:AraC family transcriptional regulator
MILQGFPDLQWLKRQAEDNFSARRSWNGDQLQFKGWPNVVLNVETSQTIRDNIRGPLSIFMNITGQSSVTVDGKTTCIKEGFFSVSNHDQYYTLTVDKGQHAETFNVHFGEYFADQIWQALTHNENYLLENPFQIPIQKTDFHNKLNLQNAQFRSIVHSLREHRDSCDSSALVLEEKLSALIQILLLEEKQLARAMEKLPLVKNSTKREILRRLTSSTDFIYENYNIDLSLEQIASASCLSKFHFLRLFKTAFEKTPGQFLDELRIAKASEMLRKSDAEVSEIAKNVGYKNSSSFSRLFRNHVGLYPSQFRSR